MDSSSGSLVALAQNLLEQAKVLDAYREEQAANIKPDEPYVNGPPEIEQVRKAVIDLSQDVKRLAQGPRDQLMENFNKFTELANFHFIYHHNIPSHVPLNGTISYGELATIIGVDPVMVRRMLRVAMMNGLFEETSDGGSVRHSAATRILNRESEAMDTCGFFLEEMFPSAAKMVAAMDKYPGSGEPNETGFNLAFNTSRPFYLELEADKGKERSRRFGAAMMWMSQGGRYSSDHIARGFDWASRLGSSQTNGSSNSDSDSIGIVVDVGGGHGAVSLSVAKVAQKARFVVQDLPETVAAGAKLLAPELRHRIEFMPHDFFAEQPVRGADVYLLRYILHNWSDKYAKQILGALLPALKDGATVLCCDFLPGDVSTTAWSEKQVYNMDMIQAIGWNSIERTVTDWKRLFASVDPRLHYVGTTTPPGSAVSIIEARFWLSGSGPDGPI